MQKIHTPNQTFGRGQFNPKAIVIHTTGGSSIGAIKWCLDVKSQVSYHYIVKEDGTLIELVPQENIAWHAGKILKPTWKGLIEKENPNNYTLGIAFAGTAEEGPNIKQFLQMAYLIKELSVKFKIDIDREHIIGHNEIRADKDCPGQKLDLNCLTYLASMIGL